MKKNEIKVGGMYRAKVSDKVVAVRIDSTHTKGGWNATNTATGKQIRIKSAQRLRGAAKTAAKGGTKTKSKTATKGATKKAKSTESTGEKKTKRVSALDAAAQVLAKVGKPMRAKELIAAMAEQNLWKSPAGKTPHNTLYAAILRESRDKGSASRFKRAGKAQFAFNG